MRTRNKALGITFNPPKNFKKREIVIITCGWNSGRKRATYTSVQALCAQNNLASITFDFQGTGESPGKLDDTNLATMVEDIRSIIKFAKTRIQNLSKITIIANSLSAEAVLLVASNSSLVKKLILCSAGMGKGIAKVDNSSRELYWNNIKDFTGISLSDYKSRLKAIGIPITIIHSKDDEKIPYSQAQELEELLVNAEVNVNLVEGTNHKFEGKEHIRLELIANALLI